MNYDSNPISVFTRYSHFQIRRFYQYHNRLYFKLFLTITIIYASYNLVLLLTGRLDILGYPFAVMCLFLFLTLQKNMTFFSPRDSIDKARLLRNGEHTHFYTYDFTVHAEQENYKIDVRLHYSALWQVVEDEYAFYLYETQQKAYIVDKQGISNDDYQHLRDIFIRNIDPNTHAIRDGFIVPIIRGRQAGHRHLLIIFIILLSIMTALVGFAVIIRSMLIY